MSFEHGLNQLGLWHLVQKNAQLWKPFELRSQGSIGLLMCAVLEVRGFCRLSGVMGRKDFIEVGEVLCSQCP